MALRPWFAVPFHANFADRHYDLRVEISEPTLIRRFPVNLMYWDCLFSNLKHLSISGGVDVMTEQSSMHLQYINGERSSTRSSILRIKQAARTDVNSWPIASPFSCKYDEPDHLKILQQRHSLRRIMSIFVSSRVFILLKCKSNISDNAYGASLFWALL